MPNIYLILSKTFINQRENGKTKWYWLPYSTCPLSLHACLCRAAWRRALSAIHSAQRLTSELLVFIHPYTSTSLWSWLSQPTAYICILILSFAYILGLLQVGSPWYNLGFSQKWQWFISLTPDSLLRNYPCQESRIQTRLGITIFDSECITKKTIRRHRDILFGYFWEWG